MSDAKPYHASMGAPEALIVIVLLAIPLVVVVAVIAGLRRRKAKEGAIETRLARLEEATLHDPD